VLARVVLAALLVVLVLVGLRGGLARPGWSGPYQRDGIAIGIAAEIVLAGLLAAVLVRGHRAPDDFLAGRLRQVLRGVLLAALITIPVALLASARLRGRIQPQRAAAAAADGHRPPASPGRPEPAGRRGVLRAAQPGPGRRDRGLRGAAAPAPAQRG
jgi:hypothetical protein